MGGAYLFEPPSRFPGVVDRFTQASELSYESTCHREFSVLTSSYLVILWGKSDITGKLEFDTGVSGPRAVERVRLQGRESGRTLDLITRTLSLLFLIAMTGGCQGSLHIHVPTRAPYPLGAGVGIPNRAGQMSSAASTGDCRANLRAEQIGEKGVSSCSQRYAHVCRYSYSNIPRTLQSPQSIPSIRRIRPINPRT